MFLINVIKTNHVSETYPSIVFSQIESPELDAILHNENIFSKILKSLILKKYLGLVTRPAKKNGRRKPKNA